MIKVIRLIFLACFIIIIFTGCNELREIDRVTFPVVLGIDFDQNNNKIKIDAQVTTLSAQMGGQNQSATSFNVLEGEGATLKEAMDDLNNHAQQYISWKQLTAIVFTDKIAKHGLADILDILSRNEEIHFNCNLLVTTEKLKDLLGSNPIIESGLPSTILGVSLISIENSTTKAVTLKNFIVNYVDNQIQPVLPLVTINSIQEKQSQKYIDLQYNGLGAFKNDKFIGWMDEKETSAYRMISGIKNQGTFSVFDKSNKKEEFTIDGLSTDTTCIPTIKNNKPSIVVEISAEYDLFTYNINHKIDEKEVKRINETVGKQIKNQIEAIIIKAQTKFKSDIFGFGAKIYRKNPQYWKKNMKNWNEIFSNMDIKILVDAKLINTRQLLDNFKYQKEKEG